MLGNNIIVNESGTASNVEKYKIVILGDQCVGKTSILSNYKNESMEETYAPTVGIDFLTKNVFLEDKTVRLMMWDTAGQERFKSLIPSYLKNADSIILTYDVTCKSSFLSLRKWLEDIKEHIQKKTFIIVAGNKVDLVSKKVITKAEADKFCEENNLQHIETSAVTGEGIKKLFDIIAYACFDLPHPDHLNNNNHNNTIILDPQMNEEDKVKKNGGCCAGKKSKKDKKKNKEEEGE